MSKAPCRALFRSTTKESRIFFHITTKESRIFFRITTKESQPIRPDLLSQQLILTDAMGGILKAEPE